MSSNTNLTSLSCSSNRLTGLDLSNNPGLNTGNVYADGTVNIIWSSTGE